MVGPVMNSIWIYFLLLNKHASLDNYFVNLSFQIIHF